uniref:Uncharacterized protein n=1 Tax=Melanopsichium pennsylvanicum 4 TaxID=1398559 RepID=A0A077QSE6_9BASI|nr:putative protein [Melanopsichium pennsylvanicum 4]
MSEERSGEVAVATLPLADQSAANHAEEQIGSSAFNNALVDGHADSASTQAAQHSNTSVEEHQDTAASMMPASASERDVEAMTGVHERSEQHGDTAAANNAAASSSLQVAGAPAKKFTSLNVNKRFLEKAGPTTAVASPTALKLGTSVSPRPSHRLSLPSATSRLMSAKLSSVPKAQPAGWATTKPVAPNTKTTPSSQPPAASTPSPTPAPVTDAQPATVASTAKSLPAQASAPTLKAVPSPKPANVTASQVPNTSAGATVTGGAAAPPRLVSMGRDSPRPGSAGLESGSVHGRASPGLRNAALGTSGTSLRAISPANVSRAPWAGVKSSLSPNPTSTGRGSTLSDFPTAAEAARAKQEQEEKAAAAAAREAAKQQAALQALDRFRGTSLGSGKHWDEMEDEDGGFLGEVVEFGDGSQYKIPTSNENGRDDGVPVSKEDRFKDVSHDRSWPQRNAARTGAAVPNDRARPTAAQPVAWGPMKNREMAPPTPIDPAQPSARPSRSEMRAEKVIIPTTGASVSLRSPTEIRDPSGYSYGRERRSGLGPGPASYGGRYDQSGAPPAAQAASAQAARAWGPLAQRQASLNPGAAPPVSAPAKPVSSSESVPSLTPAFAATPAISEPVRPVATLPPVQQQQQQPRALQPIRDRAPASAREPSTLAAAPPSTNGRPLPPHLLVAGAADSRAPVQSNRPLPPHLAQNLRPAAPVQSQEAIGRKTSHSFEEVRRPAAPPAPIAAPPAAAVNRHPSNDERNNEQANSQLQFVPSAPHSREYAPTRAPWGPKAVTQTKAPTSADAPAPQSSFKAAQAPASLSSAGPAEDVHASIERARKRREEEEKARAAEKERARQKALAIEERLRAAEQQKEAEVQRAAQRQVAEAANSAAAAAAAATAASQEAPRKTGPADSAASWRTARPHGVAAENGPARTRQHPLPAMPTEQFTSSPAHAEQNRGGSNVSSPQEHRLHDERRPSRQEQRDQRLGQPRNGHRQAETSAQSLSSRDRLPRPEGDLRALEIVPKVFSADAPKMILARPTKSPATSSTGIRIRGTAPVSAAAFGSQSNALPIQDQAAPKADTSPHAREATTQNKPTRSLAPAAANPLAPSSPPAPVRLYPVVQKEPVETKQEAAQDAPPAWNRFVVLLKGNRTRPRLNRYQQKQLFARIAAMKAPGRPVYPLTWDPPLPHLSIKTLSRDDQLFPKRYHRGTVITPVKLPSRVLPRGLPPVVPYVASQSSGARKQARFDLTPQRSDNQRTSALGNGISADAEASSLSPDGQIQVRLPGHHATVVQPHGAGSMPESLQATTSAVNRRHVDTTTDAIIGEVLSARASQPIFEDRSRAFHAAAASSSLGPLDHPQNGYSADAFGPHNPASGYRSKGRRGSNAAVAFFDDRQVSTPSPVSFMVNSEIKADQSGTRGTLSPFAIPGSTRASQTQTPASGGSMLPSPSLSTQGTWGQSSLTFPVLETRSSNLPDRDHIKNVWSLATNSHAGETQNSLKDIGDDFLPSTMPMSVHDFRADESHLGHVQQDGDRWASSTFNRFHQYSRAQHDVTSNSRDLSPVNNRSNGFDSTSRSPSLGLDASAAAARARETAQQHQTVSQQASNAYSTINGSGAYSHHQTSSYSPRERQQDGGNGLGQNAFGAYGGYGSNTSNSVSSMTTDALYGMSNYGGGSMTPNRQSFGQFGSHASAAARSAPGSPYSGMSRHSNLTSSGVSGYSLFPSSTSGTRSSQTGNGMDGLGVLDDASFGAGRNQFYGARGYGSQQQQYSSASQQSASGKWSTTSSAAAGAANSTGSPNINVAGSVLRPAASVFNPSNGPIDQRAAGSGYKSATGYSGFSSSSGLW